MDSARRLALFHTTGSELPSIESYELSEMFGDKAIASRPLRIYSTNILHGEYQFIVLSVLNLVQPGDASCTSPRLTVSQQ